MPYGDQDTHYEDDFEDKFFELSTIFHRVMENDWHASLGLSRLQGKVLSLLYTSRKPLKHKEIYDMLYADVHEIDRPNPEIAGSVVYSHIKNIRKKIQKVGVDISNGYPSALGPNNASQGYMISDEDKVILMPYKHAAAPLWGADTEMRRLKDLPLEVRQRISMMEEIVCELLQPNLGGIHFAQRIASEYKSRYIIDFDSTVE